MNVKSILLVILFIIIKISTHGKNNNDIAGNEGITLFKNELIEIYYPYSSADYYMGDLEEYVTFNSAFPNVAFITTTIRV